MKKRYGLLTFGNKDLPSCGFFKLKDADGAIYLSETHLINDTRTYERRLNMCYKDSIRSDDRVYPLSLREVKSMDQMRVRLLLKTKKLLTKEQYLKEYK